MVIEGSAPVRRRGCRAPQEGGSQQRFASGEGKESCRCEDRKVAFQSAEKREVCSNDLLLVEERNPVYLERERRKRAPEEGGRL